MQRILEGTENLYWTKKRAGIVALIKQGVSYAEICAKLHTTMPTIEWVVRHLKTPPLQEAAISKIREDFDRTVSLMKERETSELTWKAEFFKTVSAAIDQVRSRVNDNSKLIEGLTELAGKNLNLIQNLRERVLADNQPQLVELETMRQNHERAMKQLDLELAQMNQERQFKLAEFAANREDKKREQEEKSSFRNTLIMAVGDIAAAVASAGLATKREEVNTVRPERQFLFGLHFKW